MTRSTPGPAILVILQNPSLPSDTFEGMDDLTPNAVIAWNVRRFRRERGGTQVELTERLGERDDKPWTFSMGSDAETAGRADRNRQFTVTEKHRSQSSSWTRWSSGPRQLHHLPLPIRSHYPRPLNHHRYQLEDKIILGRGLDFFQYFANDAFDLAARLQEFRQV